MTKFNSRSLLMLGVCFVPLTAQAQDVGYDVGDLAPATTASAAEQTSFDNDIWTGVQWQSNSSYMYGRYTGAPDNGTTVNGGFSINRRAGWDSGDTSYFQATGNNLSFENRYLMPDSSVNIKFGQQGTWNVTTFFDSIPYIQSTHFETAYSTSGALLLGTPYTVNSSGVGSGGLSTTGIGTGAGNTAADQALSSAAAKILSQTTVGTQRDKVGASLNYLLPNSNWSITTGFQHEHKEGTIENSMLIGSSTSLNAAGSATSAGGSIVYFPQPVDYDTDRFDATLAYNAKNFQNQLSYTLSHFVDNVLAFSAQDPFTTAGLNPGYQSSIYSLPPSNLAHQIKDQFAYNITPTTRFNANLGYGLQMQDSAFASETNSTATTPPAGPGSSNDGAIENIFVNTVLTTRPFTNADLKASFTYNDRDDQSARKAYYSMLNDVSFDSPSKLCNSATVTSQCSEFLSNAPYSFLSKGGTLEGGYRLISSTKLTVGDTYQDKDYNYTDYMANHENTEYAHVNSTLMDNVHGLIGVSNAVRTASGYYGPEGFAALDNSETGQLEVSQLMQYSQAARDRQEIKGTLTWTPNETSALSLTTKYYTDQYPGSPFGISRDHTLEVDPDVSFSLLDNVKTHIYYSFEQISYYLNDATSGTAVSPWSLNTENDIHSFGTNTDWQVNKDFKLGMDYNFQFGNTAFNQVAWGTAVTNYTPVSQLPSDNSLLNSLSLRGEYKVQDNITVTAGYTFERFIDKSYLNDQASTSAQYATYLLPGDGNPSYVEHIVTMALHFKF